MSVMLEDEDELRAAPLSAKELAWAKRLDAILKEMPARLKLIEVDDCLKVVDRDAAAAALDSAPRSSFGTLRKAGVVLAEIGSGTLKISGMTY